MKTQDEVDAIFEQVKHLIDSDEPIEHPWEVQPHEFTESERSKLRVEFPEQTDQPNEEEFLQRTALAIGAYHRLCGSESERISNSEARKHFRTVRKHIVDAQDQFIGLPTQLHGEIDLALQHVLQSKHADQSQVTNQYVRSYTETYSDATSSWVKQFVSQLEEFSAALDLIEEARKSKPGGKPTDRAMSYMSLTIAIAYRDCFGDDPAPIEGKSFEKILALTTQIVGRHGASVFSVMHYVRKAVKDMQSAK